MRWNGAHKFDRVLIALFVLVAYWDLRSEGQICPDLAPDPNSAVYCDGGIQDNCAGIQDESTCESVQRKDREIIIPNCMSQVGSKCLQKSVVCYRLYNCVWDETHEVCKNAAAPISVSSTMAKVGGSCPPA